MELILKISIIILLVSIFMQDLKSRSVSIMLFITLGVLMTILHYKNISKTEFIYYITFNISIVFIVMSVLYAYSRLKMSKNIQEVFGMGDFMFFIIMAIGLPAVSFLVLFSFSILFSGVVYFIFKKRKSRTGLK